MTDIEDRDKSSLFKVALLEKTLSPEGSEEQGWYRYVLENGRSTIVGQRRGSFKDVNAYATQYTEQLNARSSMSRSVWSPSSGKPAQAVKKSLPK